MAGSYSHITNEDGSFRGIDLIDNMGDAYEALEECYGMIQWLGRGSKQDIAEAEKHYKDGLALGGVNIGGEDDNI